MKLIYAAGACSLSVHILLEELQIPYEAIKVSLQDKTVLNSYNHRGYVPVLVMDDGIVMTEAISILQYLANEYSSFIPHAPFRYARTVEWLSFISSELHKGFGPLFHKDGLKEEFIRQINEKMQSRFGDLSEWMEHRQFIMDDDYTIADMYALAIIRIASHIGIGMESFPSLQRYQARLEARPAIQKILEVEKKAPLEKNVWDKSTVQRRSMGELHSRRH